MVKTADLGDRDDCACGRRTGRSLIGRVLLEAEMRAAPMIIADIGRKNPSEMRLIDDDDVIEALASDRSDQPFDVGVLPRTGRSRDDVRDADASYAPSELLAVDAIAVSM